MSSALTRPFKTLWGRATLVVTAVAIVLLSILLSSTGNESTDTTSITTSVTPKTGPQPSSTATPEPSPTTAPAPTPTTVPSTGPVSPFNGTPVEELSTKRILTVKIDNHQNARPQSGIQHADMMVEIWVEGITRFLSVWLDSDAEFLGPIRSMRPTDFAIQSSWESTFVNSGGQRWIQDIGNASTSRWFAEPPGSFRIGSRSAPHNLYGDTTAFRYLDQRGPYEEPIDPLWDFGELPDDANYADTITTNWQSDYVVSWTWNGEAYERSTRGEPHYYLDDEGQSNQITAETLVMLEMNITSSSGGGAGSAVPISETVGTGVAWVFANGKYQQGTWARDSQLEWFRLTGSNGSEMAVPAGKLWLILATVDGVIPS